MGDIQLFSFILRHLDVDYVLLDPFLCIKEASIGMYAYTLDNQPPKNNTCITDIFPELVGYEEKLHAIAQHQSLPLHIEHAIHLEAPRLGESYLEEKYNQRRNMYFNFYVYPYQDELLLIVQEVAEEGKQEQQIVQRRNELNLLNTELIINLRTANAELSRAYDLSLEGWAKALELRDIETKGHSDRVTELTLQLARKMDISNDKMIHIQRGALLHDIGKMGIPDHILFKPASLDEQEWKIMRLHPEYAFTMLSKIDYLSPAIEIPLYHHERWNGSGYPKGLKEDQIPLAARIFAVVDVFDALISHRPYRPACSKESVIEYIQTNSGVLFDPAVVNIFLAIL